MNASILKKFSSWLSLILFIVAAVLLALLPLIVFSPPLAILMTVNPQAIMVISGVLSLLATVSGFFSFETVPGKVGAIGGLVLFIAVAILLSFTNIIR